MTKTDATSGNYRQKLGRWGEEIAREYLESLGCAFIDKNVRTPDGEIDILMTLEKTLIVVEVKTRKNLNFSFPEEAVTDEKLEHILDSAEWYLQAHPEYSSDWRVDVVSIVGKHGEGIPQIEWFQNVS